MVLKPGILIAVLIILSTVATAADIVYPVVDVIVGSLLGGTVNGKWTSDTDIAKYVKGEERYRLYSLASYLGDAIGGKAVNEPPGPSPSIDIKLLPETENRIKKELGADWDSLQGPNRDIRVIAIQGEWNALPRVPKVQSTNQKAYIDAVASILKRDGIVNPKVRITRILRVDLEGDGSEEVIISATTPRYGYGEHIPEKGFRAEKDDYSLVLLRKIVKGKVKTFVIAEEIYKKTVLSAAALTYSLPAVLDVNGDGVMEIAVGWRYYEGFGTAIYAVKDGKVKEVIGGGIGA